MKEKLSAKEKELYRRTDEILHYLWDPIGVSDIAQARDEYYSYLPRVFSRLIEDAKEIAKTLEDVSLRIMSKTGDGVKLFGSVNNTHVSDSLKEQGHNIDKKFISIEGRNVKRVGNYLAHIRLHRELIIDVQEHVYNNKILDCQDISTLIKGKELKNNITYPYSVKDLLIQCQENFFDTKYLQIDNRKILFEKIDSLRIAYEDCLSVEPSKSKATFFAAACFNNEGLMPKVWWPRNARRDYSKTTPPALDMAAANFRSNVANTESVRKANSRSWRYPQVCLQ